MDYYDDTSYGLKIVTLLAGGVIFVMLWLYLNSLPDKKSEQKKPDKPKLNKPKAPFVPGGILPKVVAELELLNGLIDRYEDPADLVDKMSRRIIDIVGSNDKALGKLDGQIKQFECEWEREVERLTK